MDINQGLLNFHYKLQGKIEAISWRKIETEGDSSLLYTPGVVQSCREIATDYNKSFELIGRNNLVAVITDGGAVLGLGNIGLTAGMPVVEGKCVLLKGFADVGAFSICINSRDADTIMQTIYLISQSFGGINLEDMVAPRYFKIEKRLKELCDTPAFYDDQYGTAIVVVAAMLNALKITGNEMGQMRIVVNGVGAAGTMIGRLLVSMGFGNTITCDISGIIYEGDMGLNPGQEETSHIGNRNKEHGSLADVMKGADALVGVSRSDLVTEEVIDTMGKGIIFIMVNPVPEIIPEEALKGDVVMVGTGRLGSPSQINNILVFPGIFKGALSVRAREITEAMKREAAYVIAKMIPKEELRADYIISSPLNRQVADVMVRAMTKTAKREGITRSALSTISPQSGAGNGPRIEIAWAHSRVVATIPGYQRPSHALSRHPRLFVLRIAKAYYTALPSGTTSRILVEVPVRRIHVDSTPPFTCSSERYVPLFLPVEKVQWFAK